jgi:polygalacturonase
LEPSFFEKVSFGTPKIPHFQVEIGQFGAIGDGLSNNSLAFRGAIEACHKAGGGTVLVPAGQWLTGPIHLQSNIRLFLTKDAIIRFSDRFADYLPMVFTRWEGIECYNYSPLIYGNQCENIVICGEGIIEGNGPAWWPWKQKQHSAAERLYNAEYNQIPVAKRIFGTESDALRPSLIQLIDSKNILIEGITIKDGPQWTIHPVYCEALTLRDLKILTHGPNTDGLNPDSCTGVLVENCYFETGDDCIAINSGMGEDGWRVNRPSQNIWIRNCVMKEGHGGVVIGSAMSGSVRNVLVQNCQFLGGERGIRLKSMRGRGGVVENICFDGIEIRDVRDEAIQINMYYQSSTIAPKTNTPPTFQNIIIRNVKGDKAQTAIEIKGLPENLLRNIVLENIQLTATQGLIGCDCDQVTLQKVTIESQEEKGVILNNVSNLEMKKCNFHCKGNHG